MGRWFGSRWIGRWFRRRRTRIAATDTLARRLDSAVKGSKERDLLRGAEAALGRGRRADALRAYRAALDLFLERGLDAKAAAVLGHLVRLEPTEPTHFDRLADVHERLGRRSEAELARRRAHSLRHDVREPRDLPAAQPASTPTAPPVRARFLPSGPGPSAPWRQADPQGPVAAGTARAPGPSTPTKSPPAPTSRAAPTPRSAPSHDSERSGFDQEDSVEVADDATTVGPLPWASASDRGPATPTRPPTRTGGPRGLAIPGAATVLDPRGAGSIEGSEHDPTRWPTGSNKGGRR